MFKFRCPKKDDMPQIKQPKTEFKTDPRAKMTHRGISVEVTKQGIRFHEPAPISQLQALSHQPRIVHIGFNQWPTFFEDLEQLIKEYNKLEGAGE